MFNHMKLKKFILAISLLSATGIVFACAAHEEKANQQTNVSLASETEVAASRPNTTTNAPTAPEVKSSETAVVSSKATDPNAKIQVLEFVLTNQIIGREPKDIVDSYAADNGMAYAFARLNAKENTQVTFLWFKDDNEHRRFTTNVQPANKWRTNASIKVQPGQWKVQLLSDGQVLAERTFTVQ